MVLAVVAALLAVAGAGATPASATTLCTAGTLTAPCTTGHPGGAFTLTSTNFAQAVSGGGSFSCSSVTLSGTAPTTTATTVSIPVTLAMSGCSDFGNFLGVTVPPACGAAGASPIRLHVTWKQASAPQAAVSMTVPSGCTITYEIPAQACTMTLVGPQTLGNGTSGTGGIAWTNGSTSLFSTAALTSTVVPQILSSGGGPLCPSAGAHTGTQSGTLTVTAPTPAPGMTVIP